MKPRNVQFKLCLFSSLDSAKFAHCVLYSMAPALGSDATCIYALILCSVSLSVLSVCVPTVEQNSVARHYVAYQHVGRHNVARHHLACLHVVLLYQLPSLKFAMNLDI